MTSSTLLHRQVHPSWVQDGRITSQVFKPSTKDANRLSVYDGDQVSPEEAWRHYTETLAYDSAGVMSVSVAECASVGLAAEPDPGPFQAHAVIKFDDCPTAQIEKKAKLLKRHAESRGWLYQVEVEV